MPRPRSYAVFCLKKKKPNAQARAVDPLTGPDLEPEHVGVELHGAVEIFRHDLDVVDTLEHGTLPDAVTLRAGGRPRFGCASSRCRAVSLPRVSARIDRRRCRAAGEQGPYPR